MTYAYVFTCRNILITMGNVCSVPLEAGDYLRDGAKPGL